MEVKINNQEKDTNNRLKEFAKERKSIIKDIFKLRDEDLEECDKVLVKKTMCGRSFAIPK